VGQVWGQFEKKGGAYIYMHMGIWVKAGHIIEEGPAIERESRQLVGRKF
jgi:hypothetical protein